MADEGSGLVRGRALHGSGRERRRFHRNANLTVPGAVYAAGVSKRLDTGKFGSAPRPSRIRRDPPPQEKPASLEKALWRSSDWEIRLAIAGIVVFALGICALVFDIGEALSR